MRKILLAIGLAGTLVLTGCGSDDPAPAQQIEQSVPDCDADDIVEGDSDCFGDDLDKKKKKAKKKAKKSVKRAGGAKKGR